MKRQVVITGIGIISAPGANTSEFWQSCLKGYAPIERIPEHWYEYASYNSCLWAPLPHYDPGHYGITRVERMQLAQSSILGLCAAQQALQEAGIGCTCLDTRKQRYRTTDVNPNRAGVFAGTGVGGVVSLIANEANHVFTPQIALLSAACAPKRSEGDEPPCTTCDERMKRLMRMPARFNPFVVSMIMPNATSSTIGIRYGFNGQNTTYTCACAAGTVAIGHAFRAIQNGQIDLAIAGGSEYLRDDFGGIFRGFDIAKTLVLNCDDPQTANRPFDRDRSGFLFSEGGAAFLVLEEKQQALKRTSSPLAEILGFAETFDAHSVMAMEPDGAQIERMHRAVLEDAGVKASSIDYINAHGTGTKTNDHIEAAAIEKTFGKQPMVNSTKSIAGHSIGAAGAIEAAVTALSLRDQTTHISRNIHHPDADLNYVRESGPFRFRRALSHSFAFGGHNAALIFQEMQ